MSVVKNGLSLLEAYWLQLTMFLLAAIAILSLTPLPELPLVLSDKTHHLISYAVLAIPIAFVRHRKWLLVIVGFTIFGGMIELIQPYVNRRCEWLDFVADVVGLMLGVLLSTVFIRIQTRANR